MLYHFVTMLTIYDIAAVQFVPFKPDIYPVDSRVFCLEDIGELPEKSPPFNITELGNVLIGVNAVELTDLVNGHIMI